MPLPLYIHPAVLQRRVLAGIAEIPYAGIPIGVDAAIGCGRLQLGGGFADAAVTGGLAGGLRIPIAGGGYALFVVSYQTACVWSCARCRYLPYSIAVGDAAIFVPADKAANLSVAGYTAGCVTGCYCAVKSVAPNQAAYPVVAR